MLILHDFLVFFVFILPCLCLGLLLLSVFVYFETLSSIDRVRGCLDRD